MVLDRLFAQYLVIAAVSFAGGGLGFLFTLLVARLYGPVGLGQLSMALALLEQGLLLVTAGIHQVAVQWAATRPGETASLFVHATILQLLHCMFVWPAMLLAAFLLPMLRDELLLVALLGLSLPARSFQPLWLLLALHANVRYAISQISIQASSLVLLLVVAGVGLDLWAVGIARALAEIIVATNVVVWARPRILGDFASLNRQDVVTLADLAWPITAAQFLRGVAIGLDPLLVGFFLTEAETGHYAAAFRVFLLLSVLSSGYINMLVARFAQHAAGGPEALRHELAESLFRIVPPAVLGVIVLTLVADPMLTILFGLDFAAAAPAMSLLGVASVVSLVSRHYRQLLLALKHQREDLVLTSIGTAGHFVAKLAMIPLIGMTGAALGTLLGELVLLIMLRSRALRALRIREEALS